MAEEESIDLSVNKTYIKRKCSHSFNLDVDDSVVLSRKRKCVEAPEQYYREDKGLADLSTTPMSSSTNPGNSPDYEKLTETTFMNAAKPGDARFLWTSDKTKVLIDAMLEYKKSMSYQGLNFQSNLFNFYSEIRNRMASLYPEDDFGPPLPMNRPTDKFGRVFTYRSKIELPSSMTEGYHRIKNKIKSLRNGLVRAKVKKSFKGLNKSVVEFYDKLNSLFGDCYDTPPPLSKFAETGKTSSSSTEQSPEGSPPFSSHGDGNPWTNYNQERLVQAGVCSLHLHHSFYNLTLANTAVMVQCVEAVNKALRMIASHAHKLHERACFMSNFVKVVQQSQAGFSGWRERDASADDAASAEKEDGDKNA